MRYLKFFTIFITLFILNPITPKSLASISITITQGQNITPSNNNYTLSLLNSSLTCSPYDLKQFPITLNIVPDSTSFFYILKTTKQSPDKNTKQSPDKNTKQSHSFKLPKKNTTYTLSDFDNESELTLTVNPGASKG
jgi:hypothetical protein